MKYLIALLFFNFSTSIAYSESFESLDLALAEIVQQNKGFLGCSGLKLVISCGNGICEGKKNENKENCPADCTSAKIRSYNHQTICHDIKDIRIPENEIEVQDLINEARSKKMKIKPIGRMHSASETICSDGMAIPSYKLDKVIGISELNGHKVVEAQGGITVYNLAEWLHKHNYALEGLPHMGFRDVSIAGAIATGSHGSSTHHVAVISNIVEAFELIDGKGQIQYFERGSTPDYLFKSLSANLGLLGFVTKVKLKIVPQMNLEVKVTYHKENEIFKKGLLKVVEHCDFGQLNWFPGRNKFVKTCGVKTNKPESSVQNELLNPKLPNFIIGPFKKALQYGSCSHTVMCLIERIRYLQFRLQPPFRDLFGKTYYKSVGPAHRMVSSHLTKAQNGFFQMDWEIAVPESKLADALKALKKHLNKNKTCLPLVGIFVRYAPIEDRSLMAHTMADGKDWIAGQKAAFIEMPVYLPVGLSEKEVKAYEKEFEDFAYLMIDRFSGRPHWGKNREWTFDLALKKGQYQKQIPQFQKAIDILDPEGIFANKLSERLALKYHQKAN